jgi:hypothetical protein
VVRRLTAPARKLLVITNLSHAVDSSVVRTPLPNEQAHPQKMFKTQETQTSSLNCPQEFVEFKMGRLGVAVLRILNQKDHQ